MPKTKHDIITEKIPNLVADFMYYNRKEDEELSPGEIEQAIADGEITKEQIIFLFGQELSKRLGH